MTTIPNNSIPTDFQQDKIEDWSLLYLNIDQRTGNPYTVTIDHWTQEKEDMTLQQYYDTLSVDQAVELVDVVRSNSNLTEKEIKVLIETQRHAKGILDQVRGNQAISDTDRSESNL